MLTNPKWIISALLKHEASSFEEQVKKILKETHEYYNKMKIVPVEEDILEDVINGIEDINGVDVHESDIEKIKELIGMK